MRHVLGMAKRHLDLKGAKGPKVELDFLRLLIAVRELRHRGKEAQGYLLVLGPAISQRVALWIEKYGADDEVEILTADLRFDEFTDIKREVRANTEGMLAKFRGQPVAGRSDARKGAKLAEAKLAQMIAEQEPGVQRITDPSRYPLTIQWDYYGTMSSRGHS